MGKKGLAALSIAAVIASVCGSNTFASDSAMDKYFDFASADNKINLSKYYRFDDIDDVKNWLRIAFHDFVEKDDSQVFYSVSSCSSDFSKCSINAHVYVLGEPDEYDNRSVVEELDETREFELQYAKGNEKYNKKLDAAARVIESKAYIVEDLDVIDYLLNSFEPETGQEWEGFSIPTWESVEKAFYYSSDLTKDVNSGNFDYKTYLIDGWGGAAFMSTLSQYIELSYDGIVYSLPIGVRGIGKDYRNEAWYRVYVPTGTTNTPAAKAEAAQKRLDKVYGKDVFKIIPYQTDVFEEETYKLSFKGISVLALVECDSTKMKNGTRISSRDIATDILVETGYTKLSSGAKIEAEETTGGTIDEAVAEKTNAEVHHTYDISLKERGTQELISKINDSDFTVSIPIPDDMSGKALTAYYLSDDGELEEHEVTIKNGVASFSTNHFSSYTLIPTGDLAPENISNPNTLDDITMYLMLGSLSTVALALLVANKKK